MYAAQTALPLDDRHEVKISSKSKFSDDEWQFDSTLPGKPYLTMRWSIPLADGSALTDPQHWPWLTSCKELVYHMIKGTAGRGKELRARTIISRCEQLRFFVVQMSANGTYGFDDLTAARVTALKNAVFKQKVRKRGPNGILGSTEQEWSPGYRRLALLTLKSIVLLQPLLSHGVTLPPELAENILSSAPRSTGSTRRIPDEIFLALMSTAIRWVTEIAPVLLARSAALYEIKSTSNDYSTMVRRYKTFYERESHPSAVMIDGKLFDISTLKRIPLRVWLNHLMSACFTIIAGFTGMRLVEILSLKPGCLETLSTTDGRKLLRVNGTLYKTSRYADGEPASWIAGWDTVDNPVQRAVETLEALHARHGSLDPNVTLFTPIPEFRQGRDAVEGRSRQGLAHRVNAFAAFNGVTGWVFAAHQFRKTFARFVTLASPHAVLALQRHFKHVSVAMTERYLPTDPDLMDEIIEQSFEADAEQLDSILKSDRLAGHKGEDILKRNAALRGNGEAAVAARRLCVESTMQDPGFRMVRHVYGDCFYEASSAKCAGRLVNVGLQTCVGCKNFVVDSSHIGFWREQLRALDTDLAEIKRLGQQSDDLDGQLEVARTLLGKLADG